VREVKGSLLVDRIAEKEAIVTTQDEVDREVQRYAKQEREPAAAVRKRWQEDGTLGRIASAIRSEKTLNFLFEQARKEAPQDSAE
jgi:trigger factor